MSTFGEFVRKLRIEKSLTLREFCRIAKLDPSNWSKTERGQFPPPKSRQILEGIASVLDVEENSDDFNALFDLAAISFIPTELVGDQAVLNKLPVFFRTARGDKPSNEELEELIKMLKAE